MRADKERILRTSDACFAKGSHTVWSYALDPSIEVTLSGNDGKDADAYQLKEVRNAFL
jgi:hypothetical protein